MRFVAMSVFVSQMGAVAVSAIDCNGGGGSNDDGGELESGWDPSEDAMSDAHQAIGDWLSADTSTESGYLSLYQTTFTIGVYESGNEYEVTGTPSYYSTGTIRLNVSDVSGEGDIPAVGDLYDSYDCWYTGSSDTVECEAGMPGPQHFVRMTE